MSIRINSFLNTFTKTDWLLFSYLAYLLLQLTVYPVDREYLLTIAGLPVIYVLFRQMPVRWVASLIFLLPVLVVAQIVYSYNRFEYPWQTISDITGIFNNTGIFGGFVAMGFVAAFGLLLSAKHPAVRIVLSLLLIPVTIQLIYSQSRAAWVAAVIGTSLLLFLVFIKRIAGQARNDRKRLRKPALIVLISVLIIIGVLFSIITDRLKKEGFAL